MTSRRQKDVPPFNPDMLRWARLWRGRTPEEAAKKLPGKSPDDILSWENKVGAPTVRQARILAEFYDRHFLEFFLPSPPDVPGPSAIPDFRMYAGAPPPPDGWELRNIRLWAETQRVNALELCDELEEQVPEIPIDLFSTQTNDPEQVASRARAAIRFSFQDQMGLDYSKPEALPSVLRDKFENFGILTLRQNDLRGFGIRGICIASFPLPVVMFGNEAPSAQAFTFGHELGHILLRESGITGFRKSAYDQQPIEKWCDRFAGAFLMPSEHVAEVVGARPSRPAGKIEDSNLAVAAAKFRVSPHAMLIRLVALGYVESSFYWDVKKPEFDAIDEKYRRFGRAKVYGARYKNALGNFYTGLVLEAWSSGRITNHNAAEYMGIKNLAHLAPMREQYYSR